MIDNDTAEWFTTSAAAFTSVLGLIAPPIDTWIALTAADASTAPPSPFGPPEPLEVHAIPEDGAIADCCRAFTPAEGATRAIVLDAREVSDKLSEVIDRIVTEAPTRSVVVFLLPRHFLHDRSLDGARTRIAESMSVEWIVTWTWPRERPSWPPMLPRPGTAAPAYEWGAAVVARSEQSVGGVRDQIVRMIDLEREPASWADQVRKAKSIQNTIAEKGRYICFSNRPPRSLTGLPWTFARLSSSFLQRTKASDRIGPKRPLGELATLHMGTDEPPDPTSRTPDIITHVSRRPREVPHTRTASVPRGYTVLGPHGPWTLFTHPDYPDEPTMLAAGDVVVPCISAALARTVDEEDLPASVHQDSIRLHWKPEVDDGTRAVVLAYVQSSYAAAWLQAHGATSHDGALLARLLSELPVPLPPPHLQASFQVLALADRFYAEYRARGSKLRRQLLARAAQGEAEAEIIQQASIEMQRINALSDQDELEQRVRSYFPTPIAIRRELVRVAADPKARLDRIQLCAEYLVHFLMLATLIERALDHRIENGLPKDSQALRHAISRETLTFLPTWGKAHEVFKESVRALARALARGSRDGHEQTPAFIYLARMKDEVCSETSGWATAHSALIRSRHESAHMDRSEKDLDALEGHLDTLLELAEAVLTQVELAVVASHKIQRWGRREVAFDILKGTFAIPRRRVQESDIEIPDADVGFLIEGGQFYSAWPWLVADCGKDGQCPEVSIVSRVERGVPTYLNVRTSVQRARGVDHDALCDIWRRLLSDVHGNAGGDGE